MPRRVLAWLKIAENSDANHGVGTLWYRSSAVWFGILLGALLVICLPKSTQRLHGNRLGNRVAGLWLAEHFKEGDVILDDHSWSHFFAGGVFREGKERALALDHRGTCFVVTTKSRDPLIDQQRQAGVLDQDARVAYYWPEHCDLKDARIVVYSQPRDYQKNPWRKLRE